ncbi:MAG: hemolysin III family protein, partial [Deltaproteobacteria bacterium]|nr:hemolysin III family protein [Deltaproteobacteria bacterium]
MQEQSPQEERFNSFLHGAGALGSLLGLIVLIYGETDPWKVVSFSIFCGTMILLYSSSALYHAVDGSAKKILKKLDHLAIYLLIAGTYTPLTLVELRDGWGWAAFSTVWALATIGIVYDLIPRKSANRAIPIAIYLLMGWMALL